MLAMGVSFMKKFLISILTLIITLALIVLGLTFNLKSMIIDTTDIILKKEITNQITDYLADNTDYNKEDIKKSIDKVLNENELIKKTVSTYMDKFINVLNDKEVTDIDLSQELESIINDSEPILKEYGITISEEDKKELLNEVSGEEINKTFNESVMEFKKEMTSEDKTILNIFNFITSTSFKLMLIGGVIVLLILIALLKKSFYKWLSNFGMSLIFSGIVLGILIPLLMDTIIKEIGEEFIISYSSFSTYGYVSIGIGVILIVINILIPKIINKKKELEI